MIEDQSQLGLMNMIVDVYRGIGAIAKNPSVDPKRIAVMGYSRGRGAATSWRASAGGSRWARSCAPRCR